MSDNEYRLDGYLFSTKEDYERAVREKETIAYLNANTDSTDMKSLLRIYNRSVERESFKTIIGIEYMMNIRRKLISSGVVTDESISPVPATGVWSAEGKSSDSRAGLDEKAVNNDSVNKKINRYKEAYEKANEWRVVKNIIITSLIVIIFGMLFVTFKAQYSVFTYFTNYKEKMRNEIIDEMEEWENSLNEREQQLDERERQLNGEEVPEE